MGKKLALIPEQVWAPAYDADGSPREGAWVAEVTGLLDRTTLSKWPKGMRVIVRKERPHPGAQLRFTDVDGHRVTAFVTNTSKGQLPDLELRHRRRARAEDRIRVAKDTGLTNLPLHGFAQNQLWCAVVALTCDLTVWMQLLAFTTEDGSHQARRWRPNGSGSDSSPPPRGWSAAADASPCTWPDKAPGATWSSTGSPDCASSPPQAEPPLLPQRPRNPRPEAAPRDDTRRTVVPECHNHTPTAADSSSSPRPTASPKTRARRTGSPATSAPSGATGEAGAGDGRRDAVARGRSLREQRPPE